MKLKINNKEVPTSWGELKFGDWLGLRKSSIAEYYTAKKAEALDPDLVAALTIAFAWIDEQPDIVLPNCNIAKTKSIEQKFAAVKMIKQYEKDLIAALPFVYAIFEQDKDSYNIEKSFEIYKECLQQAYIDVYPKAISYLNSLFEIEQSLAESMITIEYEKEERAAGVEELSKFSNYSFILSLAKDYNISYQEAKKVSIEDAHAHWILLNRQIWYQRRLQKEYQKKIKKSKK